MKSRNDDVFNYAQHLFSPSAKKNKIIFDGAVAVVVVDDTMLQSNLLMAKQSFNGFVRIKNRHPFFCTL